MLRFYMFFKLAKALNLGDDAYFTIGRVEFVRLSALEQADPEVLRTALKHAEILCNRMDLFMGVAMDPDAKGQYTTGSTQVMNNDNDDVKGQVSTTDHTWKPDLFAFGLRKESSLISSKLMIE